MDGFYISKHAGDPVPWVSFRDALTSSLFKSASARHCFEDNENQCQISCGHPLLGARTIKRTHYSRGKILPVQQRRGRKKEEEEEEERGTK